MSESYSLTDLAALTEIEERTIRSYIERGLLPGAQARGRAANYSKDHLSRLQVIRSLRRARPTIGLSEIRILLQGLSPEQIDRLANGSITAATRVVEGSEEADAGYRRDVPEDDDHEVPRTIRSGDTALKLTGVERLVCLLREVSGFRSQAPGSRAETWHRIAVTPDVELSVRAGFDEDLMASFRELAELLRNVLQRTDLVPMKGDE